MAKAVVLIVARSTKKKPETGKPPCACTSPETVKTFTSNFKRNAGRANGRRSSSGSYRQVNRTPERLLIITRDAYGPSQE